ncbi:ribosome maturation factor RimM [Bacillus sp. DJP31]|uniref:ribosome maturation factor RimM n=1 Tax=Bacillus sp. DJP31 TaxID=3409789 RepID=UPI003BB58BE0
MKKWFNVGKIVNTHGIKGEIRVISSTDFPNERYAIGNPLYIFFKDQTEPIELIVETHRVHKNFNLLTFEGYPNVNDVERFKGSILKVPEDQQGDLDEGEFYYHEIIGCSVKTNDGQIIGEVIEIISTGANDVWVVKREGEKDVLIPYIKEVVEEIDIDLKEITIHLMEGLLS